MARAKRGPFRPSDGAAARAFVASVVGGAGTVPISRRTVDPSRWSDAYAARVANRLRADAEAGVPLSLQRARRGPTLAAAPRLREGHAPERLRASGLVSVERRRAETIIRRLRDRPEFPNGRFQVTASGTLLDSYGLGGAAGYSWRTILTGFGGQVTSGVTGETYDVDTLDADTLREAASAIFDHVETWELRVVPE